MEKTNSGGWRSVSVPFMLIAIAFNDYLIASNLFETFANRHSDPDHRVRFN